MYLELLSAIVLCLGCVAVAEETKLSTANNEFALSLYKSIAHDNVGKNLIFSPISISTALAMVHAGAMGNTKKQMTTALHLQKFDDKDQDIKKQYHDFLNAMKEAANNNFTLSMANGLFSRKGFTLKPAYLQDIKTNFLGEAKVLDYAGDSEGSRKNINDFASEHTNQKIKELFPKGSISSVTSLVLVNAIYFNGFWDKRFKEVDTQKAKFHISKTQEVDVEMMGKNGKEFKYGSDENLHCQVIELPYYGGKASMYVILPHEIDGLSSLQQHLTTEKLYQIIDKMSSQLVKTLKFPKFVMKQDITLVEFLKNLGMTDLFDKQKANLSAIYEDDVNQAVEKVLHKAYIGVNEAGTEAAAATGIEISKTSALITTGPEINFIADHPFMYLIVEKKTGSILFLGRMTKPPVEGERIGKFDAQWGSSGNCVMSTIWLIISALICRLLFSK